MSNNSGIQSGGPGDDGGQFPSPFQPFQKSGDGGGLFQPFQPVQKSGDGGGLFQPVQKSSDGGGLFRQVQRGSDFFDNLSHCRDDGERIKLFLATAQRPDVPLKAIRHLLQYKDQFYLAMALQSFGYISNQTIRTKLANLDYIDGLDEPLDEIYQRPNPEDYKCHSKRIFEKLSQEAQSGSELTRLSAAWAIQQLQYPQIVSTMFLFKSAEDIQRQIISENLKRLNDRYSLNDPIRYKEFIDFWVYAPKNHLLQLLQSIPANHLTIPADHLKIVDNILARLGVAGVELVTQTYGLPKFVLEAGLRSADYLFRDPRYQDYKTKEKLSNALIPFLNNTDIDLRRLAAKPINEVGSWLNTDVRAKAAVISRDWNGNIVRLGEASVPFLLQALRGSLILDIRDNRGEQVKAVQSIGTIYAVNVDKKIRNLVEFLQHREESVRSATVSLLKYHQERLDQNSRYILTALDFQFFSPTTNFNFTSVAEVEGEITSTRQYQAQIKRIFQNAISSCKVDATEVLSFLSLKEREYNTLLSKHIESLEYSQSRIKNQEETDRYRFINDFVIVVIIAAFLACLPRLVSHVYMLWNQETDGSKYFIVGNIFSVGLCLLGWLVLKLVISLTCYYLSCDYLIRQLKWSEIGLFWGSIGVMLIVFIIILVFIITFISTELPFMMIFLLQQISGKSGTTK
ncbi:hypothetical protein BCD67_16105 [Oscillatoriales cyanobacterium USR001]|nr:hypothetical protein BCD67_16105 [Oscillatoriales cyanobacterium USR001]